MFEVDCTVGIRSPNCSRKKKTSMFHIKNLSMGDLSFAIRLTDTMKWDLTDEDFKFMMALEPNGCFVLLYNSARAGIATTISYSQVGWLGNVIVDENYRTKGGGSLLVKHAIEYLTNKGVETIGLYSYLERIPFYMKHNFRYDSKFIVMKGKGFAAATEAYLKEAEKDDLWQIVELDRQCFGAPRRRLLEPILLDKGNLSYISTDGGRILGFAAAKVFDGAAEVGPLACREGYNDTAISLLKTILSKLEGYEVSMCVPEKESKILNMLKRRGFKEGFPVARMFHGMPIINNHIYVAESLERG